MASSSEDFKRCGPIHLTTIDWNNPHHRMSVAASLVKGVYMLEQDRQAERLGSQCFSPPWWEFFNFKLIHPVVDDHDGSIFGAIFEYTPSTYSDHRSPTNVIAFRGTLIKHRSIARDLKLDIKIIRNGLGKTSRFTAGMEAVQDMVSKVGSSKVWLAGHSLGAAIVMLTGKNMARKGYFLESFLFNSPYVSPSIQRFVKNKNVRHGLRFAATLIKAGVALVESASNDHNTNSVEDSFGAISGWIPNLFVNQSDPICSEYIGYFEHRRNLEDMGAGSLARLTSHYSLGNIAMNAVGMTETREALHLVPSANMTMNHSPWQYPHGLDQWWTNGLNLSSRFYIYT